MVGGKFPQQLKFKKKKGAESEAMAFKKMAELLGPDQADRIRKLIAEEKRKIIGLKTD